jgi:hypothetical protein
VWDKGQLAHCCILGHMGVFTIPWVGGVLPREAWQFLDEWVRQWLQLCPERQPSFGDTSDDNSTWGSIGQSEWDHCRWSHMWLLLHVLWLVFGAPQPEAERVAAEMGLLGLPDVGEVPQVAGLVHVATMGLQLLQVATRLRCSTDVERDETLAAAIPRMRATIAFAVRRWAIEWQSREQQAPDPPPEQQQQQQQQQQRQQQQPQQQRPPAIEVRGRPRYSTIRQLLMMLLMVVLVVGSLCSVGAVPFVVPPKKSSFRSHPQ